MNRSPIDFKTDRSMFFVLDENHNPVPATIKEWGNFRSKPGGKRVELTQLTNCWVSTVFLGTDHGYGEGGPILFETMAFEGDYHANGCKDEIGDASDRYRTWDEAVAGHKAIVSKLTSLRPELPGA